MAYSYKGTKITGTSTSAKVFSKSGISNAKANQTYFNTSTGHVYTCTTGGKAKDAKWKYTRTDICAKPTVSVTKLGAPVRGSGHTMKATWAVPGDLTNNKNGKRAQGLDVTWYLGIAGTDPKSVKHTGNERLTTSSINLDSLKIGSTTYKRISFYPVTTKKLAYVTVKVNPDNSKGNGPAAQSTRYFTAPRAPSISALTLDPANGQVSCTITTDAGNDYQERYDTRYKVTVKNTHTNTTEVLYDTSSTNTSIGITYDATGYQALNYGEYIQVSVEAWARGYNGDSGHVYANHYISFPNEPTIIKASVSSKDSAGKCTLEINTNETKEHPVDVVTLEYLPDVSYRRESEIPGGASWESSGIVDDGQCTALTIPVADLIPTRGNYTWVRLRSWHDNETVLYRYSGYMRLDDLTTPAPTAADDDITIIDAVAGGDGESAVVTLAWNKDGTDDSTGTELTWSDEEDCWKSTEDPKKYDFTWSDGPITVGADTYNDSAVITIKGLEDATKYYIRARRYLEGEPTTYSDYSNTATCLTSELPESIVATCDRYVPTGESLAVYWTFAGNGIQREWQIVQDVWYELSTDDAVNADKAYFELSGGDYVRVTPDGTEDPSAEGWYEQLGGAVIATGQNSLGSTQIGADRLASFAVNGSVSFNVQASTGSGFVVSEVKTVTIIEKPAINITSSSIVHVHEEAERNFSGKIVTFEPKEDEFVKSLKVPLEPVQGGTPWMSAQDTEPYMFRPVPTQTEDFGYESDTIVGGTVGWNQLNPSIRESGTAIGLTFTNNSTSITVSGKTSSSTRFRLAASITDYITTIPNHVYLLYVGGIMPSGARVALGDAQVGTSGENYAFIKPNISSQNYLGIKTAIDIDFNTTFSPQAFDLTQMFGATIADYIYSLEQNTAGAGVAWFRKLFPKPYYAYNAGELMSVNTSAHNTVGFNQWDEVWELGYINGSTGGNVSYNNCIRSKNYIHVVPNTTYYSNGNGKEMTIIPYDADKAALGSGTSIEKTDAMFTTPSNCHFIRFYMAEGYGTTYNNDICINLSWDGERDGEYEEYVKHSYPLDSDLTLRGIPKLDASNNLYYDGDTYESDGSVTRKYGIVDLGTLTWHTQTTGTNTRLFYGNRSDGKPAPGNTVANAISPYAQTTNINSLWSNDAKGVGISGNGVVAVRGDVLSPSDFKTAMSGVYLVYELATPTTESADPFQSPQIVDPSGTEEYVGSPIPVGHKTTYQRICPITGWTGCEVDVAGVNLCGSALTFGNIDSSGADSGTDAKYVRTVGYTNVKPNTTLCFYAESTETVSQMYILQYDATKTLISRSAVHTESTPVTSRYATFSTAQNAFYIRAFVYKSSAYTSANNVKFSINYPSTDHDYHAYNSNSAVYPVSWQTEAGTVYGGTVDLVTGVLTVDRATRTFDGTESAWEWPSTLPMIRLLDMKEGNSMNGLANWLPTVSDFDSFGIRFGYGNKYIYICQPATLPSVTDLASFKTYLGIHNLTVCYPLATPTTHQLDPVQVALLLDEQNNIWNDIGSTDLTLSRVVLDEDQLQSNNLSFTLGSDSVCDVKVLVTSQGAVGQFPQGVLRQTAGDTIYSNVYEPEWSWDNGLNKWATTIELPTGLDFWDLGNYTLSVTAVDRATGLNSNEILWEFAVAWAHQAPDPFDFVTLTPIDTVDDNDYHHQSVQIYLTPPTGADTSDVYDIYRLNGDGARLIGQSFPLTFVAMDDYAPFGDDLTLYYRVAIRTADGDVEFADIEYVQDGSKIRFDWSAGTLELPYNLSIGDKYKKSMTTREHIDGGIDGYWNKNITRTASLSSDVICLNMQDEIDAARQLARYSGPVFVRTPDGSAYEADVQVSDMSTDGTLTKIAIDATEIDLTQEFILPTPFDLESE